MTTQLGACGLDCGSCGAYLATQKDDREAQERVLADWRVRYGFPGMGLSMVTCDGCMADERHSDHCGQCEIRACVVEHGLANCAGCADFGCAKVSALFEMVPAARENLEQARQAG